MVILDLAFRASSLSFSARRRRPNNRIIFN
jgi:hypothetical protein